MPRGNFPSNEYKLQREKVREEKRMKRLRRRTKVNLRKSIEELPVMPAGAIPLPVATGQKPMVDGQGRPLICRNYWTSHDWKVWHTMCVKCGAQRTEKEAEEEIAQERRQRHRAHQDHIREQEAEFRAKLREHENTREDRASTLNGIQPPVRGRGRPSLEDLWDDDYGMAGWAAMGGGWEWECASYYAHATTAEIFDIADEIFGGNYWCVSDPIAA